MFVVGLFALGPQAAVRALAARGDWMLDDVGSSWAPPVRTALHALAAGIDALYGRGHDSPFAQERDGEIAKNDHEDEPPPPLPRGGELQEEQPKPADAPTADLPDDPEPAPTPSQPLDADHAWPTPAALHPAVAAMQPADETSMAAVVAYVVAHEPSQLGQLKALHDWVADRIAYDPEALTGVRPPQTAAAVFARRTAVCAGYAELLATLGKQARLDVRYVLGDARGAGGEVDGAGHAWNLATVNGASFLLDPTWDAGYLEGSPLHYVKHYQTDYLFTPPAIFGIDHFPRRPAEQLRTPPISRGDFMRLPQMRPTFFARGLDLKEPDRSQVTVRGSLGLTITAPAHTYVLATFEPKGGGSSTRCEVAGAGDLYARCNFPDRGEYRVQLFSSPRQYGSYDFVGELLAQDAR